ncbi:hypothetical protein [Paraburkholderia sediminicola]|jgi:hypothetical protein|uniref:hypothetical protein n=1 Tax=Paraburkholderia sediminicola TaxID=458836 RepID=UPI0038BD3772
MDYTAVVELGCAGFAGISGLFAYLWRRSETVRDETVKKNSADIEALGKALAEHKLYVAEHYVTQSELTKAVENLDKTMQRLLDAVNLNAKETRDGFAEIHRRIDTKADK